MTKHMIESNKIIEGALCVEKQRGKRVKGMDMRLASRWNKKRFIQIYIFL